MEDSRTLLDNAVTDSLALAEITDGKNELQLEADVDIIRSRWDQLHLNLYTSIDYLSSLQSVYKAYSSKFEELWKWLVKMQNLLLNLDLYKRSTFDQCQLLVKEFDHKMIDLASLQELNASLQGNRYLHHSKKKSFHASYESVASLMNALEECLKHCQAWRDELEKQEIVIRKRISATEIFVQDSEKVPLDVVPNSMDELISSAESIEVFLNTAAEHYAYFVWERCNILEEETDISHVYNLCSGLQSIKKNISKLSSHYLKLVKAVSSNNSLEENIVYLSSLVGKYKQLHESPTPSVYKHLPTLFTRLQIMEVYLHSHRIVLSHILESRELHTLIRNKHIGSYLNDFVCAFIQTMNNIESQYIKKMNFLKKILYLWQNYWNIVKTLKSSLQTARSQLAATCFAVDVNHLKQNHSQMKEILEILEKDADKISVLESVIKELYPLIENRQMQQDMLSHVSELQNQRQKEKDLVSERLYESQKQLLTFEKLSASLVKSGEKLSSIHSSIDREFSHAAVDVAGYTELAENLKSENLDVEKCLNSLEISDCGMPSAMNKFAEEIEYQKLWSSLLKCKIELFLLTISRIGVYPDLDKNCSAVMNWCFNLVKHMQYEYFASPQRAALQLKNILEQISEVESYFESVVLTKRKPSTSQKAIISFRQTDLQGAKGLCSEKTEVVNVLSNQIDELRKLYENLSSCFISLENYELLSTPLKDLPHKEIQSQTQKFETLNNNIANCEWNASALNSILEKLSSSSTCYNVTLDSLLHACRYLLHRWSMLKNYIFEKELSLKHIEHLHGELMNSLHSLKEWLDFNEDKISAVNYCIPGHTKKTYLEGLALFEKLKHSFEDDLKLLHNVNSAYHSINIKEFHIEDSVKNTVLILNSRWHNLYELVSESFDTVKSILQAFDDFDHQKEHLLLFLTETDLELTKIETVGDLNPIICDTIEGNFKLYEDEKERFAAAAKHLMQQSKPSSVSIKSSLKEVESYWDEVYKRFLLLNSVRHRGTKEFASAAEQPKQNLISEEQEAQEKELSPQNVDLGKREVSHKEEKTEISVQTPSVSVAANLPVENVEREEQAQEKEISHEGISLGREVSHKEEETELSFQKPSVALGKEGICHRERNTEISLEKLLVAPAAKLHEENEHSKEQAQEKIISSERVSPVKEQVPLKEEETELSFQKPSIALENEEVCHTGEKMEISLEKLLVAPVAKLHEENENSEEQAQEKVISPERVSPVKEEVPRKERETEISFQKPPVALENEEAYHREEKIEISLEKLLVAPAAELHEENEHSKEQAEEKEASPERVSPIKKEVLHKEKKTKLSFQKPSAALAAKLPEKDVKREDEAREIEAGSQRITQGKEEAPHGGVKTDLSLPKPTLVTLKGKKSKGKCRKRKEEISDQSEAIKQITLEESQELLTTVDSARMLDQEENLKDLLAAIKEAEERMGILIKVLAEVTPSGMGEPGPNYSHLLADCRSSVDIIQHLNELLFNDTSTIERTDVKDQTQDLINRWEKLEQDTLGKESRALGNLRNWEKFSSELEMFEVWLQKSLNCYNLESPSSSDLEKLISLLLRHKELISQIQIQKKVILMLNITGQKFVSSDTVQSSTLKQRLKTINDEWDSLYSNALKWQIELQKKFISSSEFDGTISEMELWLQESEKRIDEISTCREKHKTILIEHHTELFALKQQLEVYCSHLESLLEISIHLFSHEVETTEESAISQEKVLEVERRLKHILKVSQSLLIKCTELLKSITSSLGLSRCREGGSTSRTEEPVPSESNSRPSNQRESSFLMRVARASFPIQAILLLLLGAAILIPLENEEEISCRLSNNFASSLSPMLRYPDGPPPV